MFVSRYSFQALSSDRDYEETQTFFKDKDTSMYKMSLDQALDSIKARAAWVKVWYSLPCKRMIFIFGVTYSGHPKISSSG